MLPPPCAALPKLFPHLGPTVFEDNRIDGNCPEKTCATNFAFLHRSLPAELPPSYYYFHASQSGVPASLPPAELCPRFTVHPHSSKLPQAISMLRSPSTTLPFRSPQAISTIHSPSTLVRPFLPSFLARPAKHLQHRRCFWEKTELIHGYSTFIIPFTPWCAFNQPWGDSCPEQVPKPCEGMLPV